MYLPSWFECDLRPSVVPFSAIASVSCDLFWNPPHTRRDLNFWPAGCAQAACTEDDYRNARATAAACAAKREAGKPAPGPDGKYCAYLKATQDSCYCDKCACFGYTPPPGQGLDSTWNDEEKKAFEVNMDGWNDAGCIGDFSPNGDTEFMCPGGSGGCGTSSTGNLRSSIPFLFMAAALAAAVGSF